ncbi:MAG: 3-dehydroquinate synthase [Flavobacteriaceae bacterium]
MKNISASDYTNVFEDSSYAFLREYLDKTVYSSLFIIVDENTKNKCLPIFLAKLSTEIDFNILTIPAGEAFKNLKTCQLVWQNLTEQKADRKSIVINIGGGMVTDLGAFVAATFKRGLRFINVSTSLLGMVDASVGGKTGVDFNGLKNQIGLFATPELVIIDSKYLKTLAERELKSGIAEIVKYGLSYDGNLWKQLKSKKTFSDDFIQQIIYRSITIKNDIVTQDPKEENLRKILNFGHTIGHAVETLFLQDKTKHILTHGEAIAIGMVCETYISHKLYGFPKKELLLLKQFTRKHYDTIKLDENDFNVILDLMKHDKKNTNGFISFVLLEKIGHCKINCQVKNELIIESLKYYLHKL